MSTRVPTVVDSVGVTERRRVLVALGVPLLFLVAVELGANLGFLPFVAALGLAAYLYTRDTARETLVAGALGTGLLFVGLFLFQLYKIEATGSTEALTAAATRLSGWLLVGALLVACGIVLSRVDR